MRGWARLVLFGGGGCKSEGGGVKWRRNEKAERGLRRLRDVLVRLEVDGETAFDSEVELEESGELSP